MQISPAGHRRRNTLVPADPHGLSEAVLVTDDCDTVLEVVGGPPCATLDVFVAGRCIGSLTLDHLGAGSVSVGETASAGGHGWVPVVLRHGDCTLLRGFLGADRHLGPSPAGRS
ncbi:MAG: hypothetical protein R2707_13435 [Acidimicrobiales bacterium]